MTDKKLEALIIKLVKKFLEKEINNLEQNSLSIIQKELNQQKLDSFAENFATEYSLNNTEVINEVYTSSLVNLPAREEEIECKLRELKFKQELRKDWILFILKDVVVYALTILFMLSFASFYLFTLIQRAGKFC